MLKLCSLDFFFSFCNNNWLNLVVWSTDTCHPLHLLRSSLEYMDCVWEHLHTRLLDELFEGEGGQTPLQQVQYSNIHLFNDVNTRSKKKNNTSVFGTGRCLLTQVSVYARFYGASGLSRQRLPREANFQNQNQERQWKRKYSPFCFNFYARLSGILSENDFGHARSSLVDTNSGPCRKRTLSARTKESPGRFYNIQVPASQPGAVQWGGVGSGAGVFRPRSLGRPRGRGRRQAAPRLSGCPGSAPQSLGFAGELARRRGNAGRPFPLLVPRTGPRLPFPGGPRAWRRPAGKLTRDSRSLPPAAPRLRASGAVASATASRAAGCVPRPEARAGGPGFSAAASADSIDHLELCDCSLCSPFQNGERITVSGPFYAWFSKNILCLTRQMESCFQNVGLLCAPSPGIRILGSWLGGGVGEWTVLRWRSAGYFQEKPGGLAFLGLVVGDGGSEAAPWLDAN